MRLATPKGIGIEDRMTGRLGCISIVFLWLVGWAIVSVSLFAFLGQLTNTIRWIGSIGLGLGIGAILIGLMIFLAERLAAKEESNY